MIYRVNMVPVLLGALYVLMTHAQSANAAATIKSVGTHSMDPKVVAQCGMSMEVADIKNVLDGSLGFGCTGNYKDATGASLNLDIQYDPNEESGGKRVEFSVEAAAVNKKVVSKGDRIFRLEEGHVLPVLTTGVAYKESNCGDPVVRTTVTPISGPNWHGWIAEETFREPIGKCKPDPWYTPRFRCIHVMVGNDKMTAQLGGVCLLRKREYSLEHGFSYDLFMDMLKTLRFKEG